MFVKNRMTANPFTVGPDETVPTAVALMTKKGVRHLPVVSRGRVVGVLSKGDVDAAGPSRATSLSAGEITYLLHKLKVSKIMTRDPILIAPDALLEEAAVLMRDNKIEMLPVVEDGELVGVITESAILDAFIELLGFRDPGTRLTISAPDRPGMLQRLGEVTAKYHANVQHVAVYRGGEQSVVVLGVNTQNAEQIEAELEQQGCTVLATLVND
ncbi:MAG: CBS and ACT domain-containing protein [Actinomycetia bacterium]|nr:CBS and ACT domain-containing protein [Actinomycetes bacterium]